MDRWVGIGLIRVFRPKKGCSDDLDTSKYRMSKIVDEFTLVSKTISKYKVSTVYKRKADKVQLVDPSGTDGSKPRGILDWVEKSKKTNVKHLVARKYAKWLIPKFSNIEKGSRLTKERLDKLIIRKELTLEEKELFLEMLFNREKAIAFDYTHCRKVRLEVALPQVIKTIKHKAWQVPSFPIPKALTPTMVELLKLRL